MTFPRHSSKYEGKAFFEPQTFLRYMGKQKRLPEYKIPENIIFFFIPSTVSKLVDDRVLRSERFFTARMELLAQGRVGVLSQFGFGAPALTLHLEILVALGAKKFIGVGTSGSLSEKARVGDFVLCDKALRDEGVSYHYVPPSEWAIPNAHLCQKIRDEFVSRKLSFHESPTWTTDAFYRETVDEVRKYREMGVMTVDMEAAALFTVANHREVQAASLFAISDLLTGDEWEPHLHSVTAPLKTLLDVAITTLDR